MLFSDKEQIIYGILLVMIYTVVLDKVCLLYTSKGASYRTGKHQKLTDQSPVKSHIITEHRTDQKDADRSQDQDNQSMVWF